MAPDVRDEGVSILQGAPACAVEERVSWMREQLLAWFALHGRSFPWREPGRTPYEVVVAEILLQRTTAAGVARCCGGFFQRYPSWSALAHAPLGDIEAVLRPLGLWRRKAEALQLLALTIEQRGSQVPGSRAELERLRGIGPYTASAVLAIVYGQVEPLLDVNMARLLGRFVGLPAGPGRGRNRCLHELARLVVDGKDCLPVNLAVLDCGALVCRARRPLCPACPLRAGCAYFADDATLLPP